MDSRTALQYFNPNVFTTTQVLVLVLLSILSWILFQSVTPPRVINGKPVPGPIGLPLVGYFPFLGRHPYKALQQMRKKYGNIIGLYLGTKYTVVLNEYNVMKEVMGHPGAQDRTNLFDFVTKSGFHVLNGEKWIEQRRFCRTATRDVGLGRRYWEDLIMENTTNLTDKLKATRGQAVDISPDLCTSVVSSIVSLLIGRRLTEDKDADKLRLLVKFSDSFSYLSPVMVTSIFPGLRKFCEIFKIGGFYEVSQIVKNFYSFIREEIYVHKMLKDVRGYNDFMSIYLEKISEMEKSKNENHSFTDTMLEGNVAVLFLGASDTIYKSLCWLIRLMAVHKDVQEKVYVELMESVGKEGRVRYQERERFPYTFATVMEAQRLSSTVRFSSNRCAIQDIHINGITIPKGSEITANLWALHYDPDYWDQPELFKPERFLMNSGTKLISHVQSYSPFSFGRRNCPGTSIAYMEILFYISEIVKKFEICLPPGAKPEFKVINGLIAGLEPQPLCFKERTDGVWMKK